MHCGGPLVAGDQFCMTCGQPAAPAGAPPPPGPQYGPPPGGPKSSSLAIPIIIVIVFLLIGGGIAALFLLDGFGATGPCVYVFEGQYNRYPNYTEAECDAYCSRIQYGSCWWDGP